jgi:hypothetical protein
LGSLTLVLWLFFSNTVPAWREREELALQARRLDQLKTEYDVAIQQARLGLGQHANTDLQSLLVAIDQKGFTPFELCLAYPERPPAAPAGSPAALRNAEDGEVRSPADDEAR